MIDAISLKNVRTFKGLNDIQLVFVASFLKEQKFEKGDYIIRENTKGDNLYILYRGNVKITRKLTMEIEGLKAEEKKLASLDDKVCPAFGENGLIGAGKRSANVIAVSDCIMYTLSRQDFDEIISSDPNAGNIILKNTCLSLLSLLERTDEYVVKLATALSIAVSR